MSMFASYPDDPIGPRPPGNVNSLFWIDDWDRGVTLARDCCDRVRAAFMQVARRLPDDLAFIRLAAFGATDEQIEEMNTDELDAWTALADMVQNINDTSDPLLPHGCESDNEIDLDEVEQA